MKTITLLAVTALVGASTAWAQPQGGRGDGYGQGRDRGPKGGALTEDVIKDLDLTQEQKAALNKERKAMQKQVRDLRRDVKEAKFAVRDRMRSEAVDREALMQALEDESAAELKLKKVMVNHRLNVREIVGEEKAAELLSLMRDERGNGEGGFDGRGRNAEDRQDGDRSQRRR